MIYTYRFDPETFVFICAEEAFLDPLETEQQGKNIYMLPADSTFVEPPVQREGYNLVWDGSAWNHVEIPVDEEEDEAPLTAEELAAIKLAEQTSFEKRLSALEDALAEMMEEM